MQNKTLLSLLISSFLLALSACGSTPSVQNEEDLFRVLDTGLHQWKTYYDNNQFARQDELEQALETIARRHRKKILKALDSSNVNRRLVTAESLHLLREDKPLIRAIKKGLNDEDSRVRNNTAVSLTQIRPSWNHYPSLLKDIRDRVLEMAETGETEEREAAYYAMYGLVEPYNDRELFPHLVAGLSDESVRVRNQSVRGLMVYQGEQGTIPLVEQTLHDPSEVVRLNTLIALGMIGDRRAVPYLEDVLLKQGEEHPDIIRYTVNFLQRLTGLRENETPSDWLDWFRRQEFRQVSLSPSIVRDTVDTMIGLAADVRESSPEVAGRILSALSELTGITTHNTVREWQEWFDGLEDDVDIPVPETDQTVPVLVELLENIPEDQTTVRNELVRLLQNTTGLDDLQTPEEWLQWYNQEYEQNSAGNPLEGRNNPDTNNNESGNNTPDRSESEDTGNDNTGNNSGEPSGSQGNDDRDNE